MNGAAYRDDEPAREEVDAMTGATVIEFGNDWCGHCRAAQPHIAAALAGREGLRHIKVADAAGKRLGRSFRVKLWPTLVVLRDGRELGRVVRPPSAEAVRDALATLDAQ